MNTPSTKAIHPSGIRDRSAVPTTQVPFHNQTQASDGDRGRQRQGWPAGDNVPEPRHINALTISPSDNKD